MPEESEALDGANNDSEKLDRLWSKIGETGTRISHKRLGNSVQENKKRPILVITRSREDSDSVLEKAKILKEAGEGYKTIYIKKDVHPAVRKEWNRLRDAERNEKIRPENQGCVIRLDTRERKLYRDDVVIDSWNPHPF